MLTRKTKFFLSIWWRPFVLAEITARLFRIGARPCPSIALSGKFAILFLQFSNWSTPSLSFALLHATYERQDIDGWYGKTSLNWGKTVNGIYKGTKMIFFIKKKVKKSFLSSYLVIYSVVFFVWCTHPLLCKYNLTDRSLHFTDDQYLDTLQDTQYAGLNSDFDLHKCYHKVKT
jgi:hypothetical protein